MATTTLPRPRGIRLNNRLIVGLTLVALTLAGAFYYTTHTRTTVAAAVSTVTVTRGTITQTVSGNGTVTANQSVDLAFQTSGVVKDVLVKAGDTVKAGQALALLDDRNLQAAVTTAQANLDSAQAKLQQAQNGNATAQQIAAAQATVDSAQKAYDKTLAGPTPAELGAAQAMVTSAQAAYDAAVQSAAAGSSTLRSLKATLDEAQVTLQQAQAAYDKIAWRSDVGMSSEAKTLQTATIEYQKALADYNAQLTTSGPDAQSSIASAKAALASAQESLAALTPTAADIAAAKSTLESAKQSLAALTSSASDTDVAIAQANVTSAEQALKEAQVNLANATLTAPFDGVISAVNVVPGSSASSTAMTLVNENPLHVELKLSENNVTKAATGQKVDLTSDAVSDWKTQGTVSYVAPTGTTSNGVVTYLVRVDFQNSDARIKVGMTLNVGIVTASKENVLVVPNAAVLAEGNGAVVQVMGANGQRQNVAVQTGITDGTHTEITSGLTEGQQIVALAASTGSSSNSNNRGGPGGGLLGIP
jgi:HlyD family secretion protein